jgi:hypothetical protein
MAVTRDVAATRQRVWDALADGWTYSGWVVGNSRIRAVSSNWPAPGSRTCIPSGGWPTVINDETAVEAVSGEKVVLLAKVRPAAEARITMRLSTCLAGAVSRWPRLRSHGHCAGYQTACLPALSNGAPTPTRPKVRRSSTASPAPSIAVTESIDFVSMQIANMLGEPAIADPNLDAHRHPRRDRVE